MTVYVKGILSRQIRFIVSVRTDLLDRTAKRRLSVSYTTLVILEELVNIQITSETIHACVTNAADTLAIFVN